MFETLGHKVTNDKQLTSNKYENFLIFHHWFIDFHFGWLILSDKLSVFPLEDFGQWN